MSTRRTLAAARKNLEYLYHHARGYEEEQSAAAGMTRLTVIDTTYGDLFDAIEAGDEVASSAILARLLIKYQPPRKASHPKEQRA